GGAWGSGHQPLDEEAAEERPDVGMLEDDVERLLEIRLRALPWRHRGAIEQELLVGGVIRRPGLHRDAVVALRTEEAPRVALVLVAERPAGEGPREGLHLFLIVGRNRLILRVQVQRAVGVELVEADREQLQDLSRI